MNKKTFGLNIVVATILILPLIALAQAAVPVSPTLTGMASKVSSAATTIGLSIAVIGWITAGILYLTAAGGSRMETAKKAMIAAVIGTLLVVLGQTSTTIVSLIKDTFGLQ
jgi:hypothetical protein